MDEPKVKKARGFALLTPERRTEIARKGGQKVHALGLGHQWTKEEASKAGQVGGQISRGGRGRVTPKP
jgi:general stress protein YciG